MKSLKLGAIATETAGLAVGAFAADKVRPMVAKVLPKMNPAYGDIVIALGSQVVKSAIGAKGIVAAALDGMTAVAGSSAIQGFSGPAVSGVGNYGYDMLPSTTNFDPSFGSVTGILDQQGVGYVPGQDAVGYVGDQSFANLM